MNEEIKTVTSYNQNDQEQKKHKPKKKITAFIVSLFVIAIIAIACVGYFNLTKEDETGITIYPTSIKAGPGEETVFSEGLAPVKEDDEWGYINIKGEYVIKPQFKYAFQFSEGLAPVMNDYGDWGYINNKGEYVIEPQYRWCEKFSEGLAAVEDIKSGWGYINSDGEYVIEPDFNTAYSFINGFAIVNGKDGWVCINTKGETVVECGYYLDSYTRPQYSDDMVVIVEGDNPYGTSDMLGVNVSQSQCKLGYTNTGGDVVIKPQFSYAESFSEGIAFVSDENGYRYINKKGETVKVLERPYYGGIEDFGPNINGYTKYARTFNEGFAAIKDGDKVGFINIDGDVVIEPRYDNVSYFSDGLALVEIDGKYGYINTKGEMVIEPQFDAAKSFHNGVAAVNEGEKWGLIDEKGGYITEPQYMSVIAKEDGYTIAFNNGKFAILNNKGETIGRYDAVGCWENIALGL